MTLIYMGIIQINIEKGKEMFPNKTEDEIKEMAYQIYNRVANSNDRAQKILSTMGEYV